MTTPSRGFGLVGLGVVICAAATSTYWWAATPGRVHGPSRAGQCRLRMMELGSRLANYCGDNGAYPPAATVDAAGRPHLSWRTLLLPYSEGRMTATYNPKLRWDAPVNLRVAREMVANLGCMSARSEGGTQTNYVVVTDRDFAFDGARPIAPAAITDNRSETIVVIEAAPSGIVATEPRDWTWAEFLTHYRQRAIGAHDERFAALHADGSVAYYPYTLSEAVLRALFTISGGEDLKAMGYRP